MLLDDMDRPFHELSATATQTSVTIKVYQEFSKDIHMKSWPETNDMILQEQVKDWHKWILTDWLDPVREAVYANIGRKREGSFVLLKAHPVLCGIMKFQIRLFAQSFGFTLVNAWGALPNILHLYNACLMEGLLKDPW